VLCGQRADGLTRRAARALMGCAMTQRNRIVLLVCGGCVAASVLLWFGIQPDVAPPGPAASERDLSQELAKLRAEVKSLREKQPPTALQAPGTPRPDALATGNGAEAPTRKPSPPSPNLP
jgi:hypothetical protein